ncbi:WD40-repeat-containing domain protein [Suillus paluster]|uniref:WD40-repeat-containing domain protein n=1 Tax=Suillus paluster TaxID=48578 RepID=UPI001B861831|nr:WD40-repeat-containing domain protein [Suillus paluster]KAG1738669.1 WD40-repeat-containing domain protein [Suillus paluster]
MTTGRPDNSKQFSTPHTIVRKMRRKCSLISVHSVNFSSIQGACALSISEFSGYHSRNCTSKKIRASVALTWNLACGTGLGRGRTVLAVLKAWSSAVHILELSRGSTKQNDSPGSQWNGWSDYTVIHSSAVLLLNYVVFASLPQSFTQLTYRTTANACLGFYQSRRMSSVNTLTCLAFSPDGQKIASGTARSGVTVTDISSESRHQLEMLADTYTHAIAVAWSPDGKKIMSASLDRTMRCWNATSSHALGPPFEGHKDVIVAAGFLPHSPHAISLSKDGELLIWNTGSGVIARQATVSDDDQTLFAVALSVDGTLLVTSNTKEGIAWEIPTCVRMADIALPDVPLLQAAIIPDSHRRVVLVFGDKSFWIWDTNTGTYDDARFEGLDEDAIPSAVAVSPDGRFLALGIDGDNDHPTHFYDMKGHEIGNLNVRCTDPFAFSPDGKYFAASSVPSDSKDDSYKLVIRPVKEARKLRPHVPATTTPRDKGKQRSPGLSPGFFDTLPHSSVGAKGSAVRCPKLELKRKIDLDPPQSSAHQQAPPRSDSQTRRILPLSNIWKRIRHPRSHKARSTQQAEVPTAQALREFFQRTVVSPPRQKPSAQKNSGRSSGDSRAKSHLHSASTGETSTQPSSETGQRSAALPLRQIISVQEDPAESSSQARQRGHDQGPNDREDLESDDGIVYRTRDTESVETHGCWNTFWKWFCYKGEFLNISS